MYRFSAIYQPTTLFSLKNSNATNSGAKSLFLPSPYAIKMAIINQAITVGNDEEILTKKNSIHFSAVKDAKISFNLKSKNDFCINNVFVKILKLKEDKRKKEDKESGADFIYGVQETVAFREYVHISSDLEIIFEVRNELEAMYLKKYLYKINYFGKRGCFFQFLEYKENPAPSNVKEFSLKELTPGILQEYDDFPNDTTFSKVSNFSEEAGKREHKILLLPLRLKSSSKSFSFYETIK